MLVHTQRRAYQDAEAQFSQQDKFRVTLLRNRQIGLWAANMLELSPDQAEDYASEIIALGMRGDGDLAIVDRLIEDFADAGMIVSAELVHLEMAQRMLFAEQSLTHLTHMSRAA